MTRKLDYIADMGFTCLQLLPHTEFGGQWWGAVRVESSCDP
jgi:1,4-alpha-glucan branching enzyme